jgi:acyl-CoA dehydrogenase
MCPAGDATLEMTKPWDVLGFRGTCSPAAISSRPEPRPTMWYRWTTQQSPSQLCCPVSHTLRSSAWLGIADAALHKARKATREAVRKGGSKTIPQAAKLADLTVAHQSLEAVVMREVNRYEGLLKIRRRFSPLKRQ